MVLWFGYLLEPAFNVVLVPTFLHYVLQIPFSQMINFLEHRFVSLHVENSLIFGCSPSDVIPNLSTSSAFLERKSFCSFWDFGLSVISGVVHKLLTSVKLCSSVEVQTPAFSRIQESSLILMSTFESILLVGRSCFTQGLVLGVLTVPKKKFKCFFKKLSTNKTNL